MWVFCIPVGRQQRRRRKPRKLQHFRGRRSRLTRLLLSIPMEFRARKFTLKVKSCFGRSGNSFAAVVRDLPNQWQNRSCLLRTLRPIYERSFYVKSSPCTSSLSKSSAVSRLSIISTSHPASADFTSLIIPTGATHRSILQNSYASLQYVFHGLFKTIGLHFPVG